MSFEFSYSDNLSSLFKELNISLIFTTYQANRVVLVNSNNNKLEQLVRFFPRPMGIAQQGNLLSIAMKDHVAIFKNDQQLAKEYPSKPNTYDSLFFPIAINFTGKIDAHDICFSKQGLIVVSTAFNSLCKIDGTYSFNPIWKPSFISDFFPSDKCHLNGLALDKEKNIAYVTAFAKTNDVAGWKKHKQSGILLDIKSNKIICNDLQMPHSPCLIGENLYLLESYSEELVKINLQTMKKETIYKFKGFVRGLTIHQSYAFIGVSKFREQSLKNLGLPINNEKVKPSIIVFDLKKNKIIGSLEFDSDIEEIYDVDIIQNSQKVNILNSIDVEDYNPITTPIKSGWFKIEDD